ncbi:MAG TPA: hypothetical protein VFE02_12630 [Candidatus Acidoferrales bacterium]|nr:hypothetical protein [Candidatus Acidoferrales bacterium]
MRPVISIVGAFIFALGISVGTSAQSTSSTNAAATHKQDVMSGGIPDLSGLWDPDFHGPEGTRINTWDSSDPYAAHPEQAPMTPWAAEKFKDARPPFGARQTYDNTNDPVQRFCDPAGIPRIYFYPWLINIIQTPKTVYILYEYSKVWRAIAMNTEHPKDPDSTWMGDAVGKYEGDTLVVDTIGFNDKTWLDQAGHPHSDALHVIERFRRRNQGKLELNVTIDDPKAYTRTFSATKMYNHSDGPVGETLCAYSEMKEFQENVVDKTQTPPVKPR